MTARLDWDGRTDFRRHHIAHGGPPGCLRVALQQLLDVRYVVRLLTDRTNRKGSEPGA